MHTRAGRSKGALLYLAGVITIGSSVAVQSALDVYANAPSYDWLILAALTLLTGSFTVKLPGLLARISVSEAFVFASVLSFGPAVATVIVSVDSMVATLWMQPSNRSMLRSLFNLSSAALSIWTSSHVFFWLASSSPGDPIILSALIVPLFFLALLYFLINSWLVAIALGLDSNISAPTLWWEHFPWLSLNYFGGASVAALLVSHSRSVDPNTIGLILPILVITYLTYRSSLARLADAQRHISQVNDLYLSTIEALAMAVDAKDQITHGHIRRVQVYAIELAQRLGVSDDRQIKAIETAALLHDMGKLAIPETILNKPGKLTAAEFSTMKCHADIGADLLSSIRFPFPVVPIVRHHHENWDGTGYPSGISGTDIPLGARILAVVDCFDALTSDRPYRARLDNRTAFRILLDRRGSMYDPLVVETFVNFFDDIAPKAVTAGHDARTIAAFPQATSALRYPSLRFGHADARAGTLASLPRTENVLLDSDSRDSAIAHACLLVNQLALADACAFYAYRPETDSFHCTHASGADSQALVGFVIAGGDRVTGWAGAHRQAVVNGDARLDLASLPPVLRPPMRHVTCCPVISGVQTAGVLTAYCSRLEGFDTAHIAGLRHVGALLALRLREEGVAQY